MPKVAFTFPCHYTGVPARRQAGLSIPERTIEVIEDLGLQSEVTDEFGLGMQ